MKIGVFGDSYAEKNCKESLIWWGILNQTTDHEVVCHGESASSIIYSAKKILEQYQDYDLVIWCLTQGGRQTVYFEDRPYHFAPGCNFKTASAFIQQKFMQYIDHWSSGLLDWENERFNGRNAVHYVTDVCKNVMVIPCFQEPLACDFNLFELSKKEAKFYFGEVDAEDFYNRYHDLRAGHLSPSSQKILASEIEKKLVPGIFQTEYSKFSNPVEPVDKLFKKI